MTEMALAVVRMTIVCAWKIFDAVATVAATERKHSRKLIPAAPNEWVEEGLTKPSRARVTIQLSTFRYRVFDTEDVIMKAEQKQKTKNQTNAGISESKRKEKRNSN